MSLRPPSNNQITKNDKKMSGNTNEVYSVQGTQFSTTESLRAINRAKEQAVKVKQATQVLLNGLPVYLIDRKGNLVAA